MGRSATFITIRLQLHPNEDTRTGPNRPFGVGVFSDIPED